MSTNNDLNAPIFPLEFSVFERYMIEDDSEEYPMITVVRFYMSGELRRDAWDAALARALVQQPLLTARLGSDDRWHDGMNSGSLSVRWLGWSEDDVALDCQPMNLEREAGLRIFAQDNGAGRARITCQVHHAVSDAIGIVGFFRGWVMEYQAELAPDRHGQWQRAIPSLLVGRGAPRWRSAQDPGVKSTIFRNLFAHALRFFTRNVEPVSQGAGSAADSCALAAILHSTLNADVTIRLRQSARDLGATLNDLAIASLFRALGAWNARSNPGNSRKWLVILVPINLRVPADSVLPAANVISYAFLGRRQEECVRARSLMPGLVKETSDMRIWNFGQYFLEGLSIAQRIPGFVRWWMGRKSCLASAVLSNFGDLDRDLAEVEMRRKKEGKTGGIRVEKVVAAPPIHRGTRVVFVLATCQGKLTVSMRHDPRWLGESDADAILRSFVANLVGYVDEDPSASAPP